MVIVQLTLLPPVGRLQTFECSVVLNTRARYLVLKYKHSLCLTGVDQVEKKFSHCFSEPWEDSDVILVVENEKFHVHRLILSMNSPVFKAMFKSQFKESTAIEIPLPEKEASEVLDFLRQIYFQYIEERVEITSKVFVI